MTTSISRHHRTTRVTWATITTLAAALAMVQLGAAPDATATSQRHPDPMSWIMSEDFPDICAWPDLVVAVGLSDLCPGVAFPPSTMGI